jgi:uncharacterized membrane protein
MGLSAPIEAVTSCNYQQKMAQKMHQSPQKNGTSTSGWWLSHSSEKYEFVSWDEYSQSMEKQFHVPKHQPNIVGKHRWTGLHIIDIIPDHFLYSSLCQNGHRRAPLCCE